MLHVLWIFGVIFFVLWATGLITSNAFGGRIHILLALAVIAVAAWAIWGRA